MAALLWLLAKALSADGFGVTDAVLLALFAITLPWTVIGFWNAAIGYLVLRLSADPAALIAPAAARIRGDEPIAASTAVLVCIRNETPRRIVRNLLPMLKGLDDAGLAQHFHVYVLSDTSDAAIAQAETEYFARLETQWRGRIALTYRRRPDNAGFKAGNIADFCRRWGGVHDFALVLDADSVMASEAVLRLVRIMQADPRLGILQSLVVGLPSTSAFTRIFQFGMRLGMRSYTIGSAWWQADCGPYWGHNALIRLKPFIAHCQLTELAAVKRHGDILSHDQIEAVLMRRAGYDVRVLPEEHLSFEDNPPDLIEFVRRDLRWCRGNMQYWRFLAMPGLKFVSRCQLAFAMLMFLGSPAWIGLLVVGAGAVAMSPDTLIDPDYGMALLGTIMTMWFAPKIATAADILARPDARRAFGGTMRLLASIAIETIFFILLSPVMWLGHTLLLATLPFGRGIDWTGQIRDGHAVSIPTAARAFWPHTLVGVGSLALLAATQPSAIPYALLTAGGLALAIPLAVVTARPALGNFLAEIGIGRLPEETAALAVIAALDLPAIEIAASQRTGVAATALGEPACSID